MAPNILRGIVRKLRGGASPTRSDYRRTWEGLSDTEDRAKMHVMGDTDEAKFAAEAEKTLAVLRETVGVGESDTILEIGCGVGRVGAALAPVCKRWIGCDVSSNMLRYAAARLANRDNVEFHQLSGYDLSPVADASVDMVYCTVVFMHLEEWDRYNYVLEARRILKPGGRLLIDNFDLRSDEGWEVFETHRAIAPANRPPHISRSSTPQELETYLNRAGFRAVALRCDGAFVRAWGRKPE